MKRSQLLATVVVGFVLCLGVLLLFQNALATNHTLKYTRVKITGVPYVRFDSFYKMGAATDTLILPFSVDPPTTSAGCDSILATLNIYTARIKAADSVSVNVKYQYSTDGVTWSTAAPLGTDSLTWATANVAPTYKLNSISLGSTYGGGWQPYYRLLILPRTGNDSARVKVDIR